MIDRYEKKLTPVKQQSERGNKPVSPFTSYVSNKSTPTQTTPPSNPMIQKQNVNPIPLPSSPAPQSEISRSIIDRLLDYIIGDSPTTGFALICKKCHFNNGLIPKDEMESAQFICKRCQFFNSGKKDLRIQKDEDSNDNDFSKKKNEELIQENDKSLIIEDEHYKNNQKKISM